ncbi:MAG: hypothetical protein ACTHK7_10805 [Aureliella sp.]
MLAELVIAIAVSSILLLGIQSALSIALRGVPDPKSGAASTLQANRIVDQLTTELETAIYISERSATSIGFTIPDRNGDGNAERVRYAWTGTPGGILTRQYNGGTVETIGDSVDLFNLTPSTKSVSASYPLAGVEDLLESLLVDNYSTSGLGNNDVTTSNWLGQYFTLTLPAGAVSWRPTRVQFMAKKNSVPGTTSVELQTVSNLLTPSGTVVEQYTLADTAMTTGYAWQSFNITKIGSQTSGSSFALVLRRTGGSKSLTAQSTNAIAGMEKSSNGNSWSYDNGKALVSRLYGKLTRSTGTGSYSTRYYTSMDLALRMSATAPTLRTTAGLFNHPEVLTGKWELKFDQNPTTVDINGDGAPDWSVSGGGTFDTTSVTNGVWRSSGVLLNTSPGCDFAQTTVVDVKFQSMNRGGRGAIFSMNALRSGSTCAPVTVTLAKQADGTQTLSLQTKTADLVTLSLLSIDNLPAQPVYLQLVLHPGDSSISMTVNGVEYGTFTLIPFLSSDASRAATIGADGGVANFWYASIRVLEN